MKHRWIAVLSFVLLAAPSIARAADTHLDVKKRIQQGTAAFGKGDYAGAIEAFSEVYIATGETKYLFNLALAEYAGQHAFDAFHDFKEFAAKADASPADVAQAQKLQEELAPKLEHLTIVAPKGATVLIDGIVVGTAPLPEPVTVDPDKPHAVIARQGNDEAKEAVSPPGPQNVHVDLSFPAPPPAAPVASEPAPPPPSRQVASPLRTWVAVGLGGAAVLSLGGGVFYGIQSSNAHSDAAQIRGRISTSACPPSNTTPTCVNLRNDVSSVGTAHNFSEGFYVASGVLAAGAVAAWVLIPKEHTVVEHTGFVPILTPQLVGAMITEAF